MMSNVKAGRKEGRKEGLLLPSSTVSQILTSAVLLYLRIPCGCRFPMMCDVKCGT